MRAHDRYHAYIMTTVSLLAILAAGVANLILGSIWYHPRVFGTAWARLLNVSPEMAERGKKRTLMYSGAALVAGMLAAFVLGQFATAWGIDDWAGATRLALWSWAGFVVPTSLGTVLWEHRPFKLYLINIGYWFASFIIISLILTA